MNYAPQLKKIRIAPESKTRMTEWNIEKIQKMYRKGGAHLGFVPVLRLLQVLGRQVLILHPDVTQGGGQVWLDHLHVQLHVLVLYLGLHLSQFLCRGGSKVGGSSAHASPSERGSTIFCTSTKGEFSLASAKCGVRKVGAGVGMVEQGVGGALSGLGIVLGVSGRSIVRLGSGVGSEWAGYCQAWVWCEEWAGHCQMGMCWVRDGHCQMGMCWVREGHCQMGVVSGSGYGMLGDGCNGVGVHVVYGACRAWLGGDVLSLVGTS